MNTRVFLKIGKNVSAEAFINMNTFEDDESHEDLINRGWAYAAVQIAIEDEREKAINAFCSVMENAVMKTNEGVHIDLNILKEQFSELLNKEDNE